MNLIQDTCVFIFAAFLSLPLQGEEFRLTSQSFEANGTIPEKFTCNGEDLSPALSWKNPPLGTKSFALIVDDPDAPGWTRIHWVVYNIPAEVFSCEEGEAPKGAIQGANDQGKLKYRGPCPPEGIHRYFFKLYALKQPLSLPKGATKEQVEKAMQSLILGETQLIGRYGKK